MIRSLSTFTATPPRTTPVFPPVLGDDAVEVLGPCRPAFDIPRVIVTVLVAQHRALAGRVGAGGMPGVLAPRQQVALQGGLEGRGGVRGGVEVLEMVVLFCR